MQARGERPSAMREEEETAGAEATAAEEPAAG
jgi:hypothetical protein